MHICLQGIGCVCMKNYPPELVQPSSSTRVTIVSTENQNGATIVKAISFLCHYYIVWESNNASEARGQSWHESLKSRRIPGGLCGLYEWYKTKTFCRAFFAAAMMTMVAAATISCGFPHYNGCLLYQPTHEPAPISWHEKIIASKQKCGMSLSSHGQGWLVTSQRNQLM